MGKLNSASRHLQHFWHAVSNIRPIVWITLYLCLVPVFALIYWALPDGQFRIPDGGTAGYGGWLYYSIVTITTLGFGDYTPAHSGAQWVTAIEVLMGLVVIGFFLNAVGSMKSEIDVESELEKQKRVHEETEKRKLIKYVPIVMHKLNQFMSMCYAVTTPLTKRDSIKEFNPGFTAEDMVDMHKPSGLPDDHSGKSAIQSLVRTTDSTCLVMDAMQQRIDLTLWPGLLEDCFAFVANFQMLAEVDKAYEADDDLINFIKNNVRLARNVETLLTEISSQNAGN